MRTVKKITLLFLIMTLGVLSFIYFPRRHTEELKKQQMAAILIAENAVPVINERMKESSCFLNGALPDKACTPGSIFKNAAIEQICVPGYTKTVRNVSQKLRQQVYAEYSISYPQPIGAYEVDHLIPLALGGNNDIANLWTEPAEPAPGFKEKDVVEIFLQQEVCAGRADLGAAQRQIASDWLAIYNNLTEGQIEQIKSKYRSWAN